LLLPGISGKPDLQAEQDTSPENQQERERPIPAKENSMQRRLRKGEKKQNAQTDPSIDPKGESQAVLTAAKARGEEA
jgi:hypothetical protein